MKEQEVRMHLDSIIGEDSQNLSDFGFMIALCRVYSVIRPVLIVVKPFLILKKSLAIGAAAFLMLMDSRCKVNPND